MSGAALGATCLTARVFDSFGGGGVAEEREVDRPWRVEIGEVRSRQRAVSRLERGEVVGQLEREAVGLTFPVPRERGAEQRPGDLHRRGEQQDERYDARIASATGCPNQRAEGRPEQKRPEKDDEAREAGHPEQRALHQVVGTSVPELVCEDEPDLQPVCPRQQRVVENEAARAPEPRYVGVGLASSPARIRDEHLLDRSLRPRGQAPAVRRSVRSHRAEGSG